MSFTLSVARILILGCAVGVLTATGLPEKVGADHEEYPEIDDINKCDRHFQRICAMNNYGYPSWIASECLLKYRNYWERTVNTKWDLRFKMSSDDTSCTEYDAKQCNEFNLEKCKDTFGYEKNFEVCKSNGKDYQHFETYCDFAAKICNTTDSGWATVKRGPCDFKFQ